MKIYIDNDYKCHVAEHGSKDVAVQSDKCKLFPRVELRLSR